MKFSNSSFFIGVLIGAIGGSLVAGAGMVFLFTHNVPGTLDERLLFSDAVREIRESAEEAEEITSQSVFGRVVSVGGGRIELAVSAIDGAQYTFEFRYDAATEFYTYADDDESSEIPITVADIAVGEHATIVSNETINPGAVEQQYYAETVLKL